MEVCLFLKQPLAQSEYTSGQIRRAPKIIVKILNPTGLLDLGFTGRRGLGICAAPRMSRENMCMWLTSHALCLSWDPPNATWPGCTHRIALHVSTSIFCSLMGAQGFAGAADVAPALERSQPSINTSVLDMKQFQQSPMQPRFFPSSGKMMIDTRLAAAEILRA